MNYLPPSLPTRRAKRKAEQNPNLEDLQQNSPNTKREKLDDKVSNNPHEPVEAFS